MMKKRTIFSVITAICLLLSACANRSHPSSSSLPGENSSGYASQTEERSSHSPLAKTYSFETLPGVDIPQIVIHKILFYDGAMGERGEATMPGDIEQIMNSLCKLEIYNEKTEPNPTTASLSYGCLYWLDFFEAGDDKHPAFSIGLDSFFIEVDGEKIGPYRTENEESVITEILRLF